METEVPLGFTVGDTFKTLNEFHEKLLISCKDKYVQFYKRDTLTVASALKKVKRYLKEDLEYYKVQYCCIYGGREFKSVGTGKRNKKTFRTGPLCPATLTIRIASSGDEFELISLNMIHNHPIDPILYGNLPHQRKFSKIMKQPKRSRNLAKCFSDEQLYNTQVNTTEETHRISIDNVNQLCRLCISERNLSKSKDIFQRQIRSMVEYCSSVRVSEDDGLPSRICLPCLESLTRFYSFKKKIERTDNMLKSLFQSIESKPNILDMDVHKGEMTGENCDNVDEQIVVGYSEDSHSIHDTISADLECGFSFEVNSIEGKSHPKNIPIVDLNIEENKSPNYYAQSISAGELDFIENDSQEKTETILSIQRKNNQKSLEYIDKNEIAAGHIDNETEISEDNITVGMPSLIPADNITKTKMNSHNLPKTPPPLILLKPNACKSIPPKANISSLQCRNCNEKFDTLGSLKKHKTECIPSNSLTCNICKKEFKERKKLIGHLKGHMISKDYGCRICGKRYPNPSTFQIHMRSHTGERPFKCSVCNKGFTRWAGVLSHMQMHDNNRPFKCDNCDKSFKILSNLERHKVLHSGSLPFCCSYCGKTFSQSENLQLHIRTHHTHEKPYLCSQCGKGFVSSTRLNRHMWSHSGHKPFHCDSCSKSYSSSTDLKNHQRVAHETGNKEKPFACKFCDMKFFHSCRLSTHLKTHQRPFACSDCNKTFSLSSRLDKHVKIKHSNEEHFEEIFGF